MNQPTPGFVKVCLRAAMASTLLLANLPTDIGKTVTTSFASAPCCSRGDDPSGSGASGGPPRQSVAAASVSCPELYRCQEVLEQCLNDPRLFARGESRVYRGEHLRAISLPLGGLGSGCIQINGNAELAVWQIFGNFSHARVPNTFFAIRAKPDGGSAVVRALQTAPVGPVEPIRSLSFRGEFPFGWYQFEDEELPVAVSLEAFSPLIPLAAKESAVPCAVFRFTAENRGGDDVEVSFLASAQNAVGFTGEGTIRGGSFDGYGGNLNRVLVEDGATVLHLTSSLRKDSRSIGDLAWSVLADGATATASWDDFPALLRDLADDGRLAGPATAGPSPAGETLDGALALPFRLSPGNKRSVTFILTWHFPNPQLGAQNWLYDGYQYAGWWGNALEVARYARARHDELARLTRLYHESLYATNLPYWLLDRISSQVAVLRSMTCFWAADDYFGGFEGCCPGRGCCHGNATHVWGYAQAHARLFPSIARRMREEALHAVNREGGIPIRQPHFRVAFDGQCSEIIAAYREHLCGTDSAWLARQWPRLKFVTEYLIRKWDRDEDGVLAGPKHGLDADISGCDGWMGSLYLAALSAMERMALLQADTDAARRYHRILRSGSRKQDALLFNGEYYVQRPDSRPAEDYNTGCHIDQVLGQWWAHQVGLGWLYPPEHVHSAVRALFRYNFRTGFADVETFQDRLPRKFVLDQDRGMVLTSWPKGGRPEPPHVVRFADEVMSGFEYSAAAAMIESGLLREAFVVVLAASDRYDGRLRTGLAEKNGCAAWGYSGNPFGDDECGKFYARAMSSWSLLLACQGFHYDGPAGVIGFKPVWKPENHVSFFTAAEGWGLFRQERCAAAQTCRIEVRYGRLRLERLVLELPQDTKPSAIVVRIGQRAVPAEFRLDGRELCVVLPEATTLEAGQALVVEAAALERPPRQ